MLALTSLISGGSLNGKVALVTDGRFSGGSRDAAVGHASPEATRGETLALVVDSDLIVMDVPARRLDLYGGVHGAGAPGRRLTTAGAQIQPVALARYSALVGSAAKGRCWRPGRVRARTRPRH